MISYEDVRNLEKNKSDEGIVSLYLRIDPHLMDNTAHPLTEFKGLFKRYLDQKPPERWLAALEREKSRLVRYLNEKKLSGRGLAIFACQPLDLWEALTLEMAPPFMLDVDVSPKTTHLLQILDESPRFVVVAIHRDQASIYVSQQRDTDKRAEIASEVQGWHSQGGWSQARFQRHIESQTREHFKKVVEDLEKMYYGAQPFHRLAIGGPEPTVKELIRLLPEPIAKTLIGTFLVDAKHETEDSLLDKARSVLARYERETEARLMDQLKNAARSGGQGVLGIEATLPTIAQGRVQTLVIADGTTTAGTVCQKCDYISAQPFQRCPMCDGEAEFTRDIVDRAAEKAFLGGAHIATVLGQARDWLLTQGGIGAILRY